MSLNATPSSERIHIGFFGLRNAGKSSLVNAVTGQPLSLVSNIKGTTTDPVKKSMELLPLGPVVIIDTPGIDDEGSLGNMRVKRALQTIREIHIGVLVVDAAIGLQSMDKELLKLLVQKNIPVVIAFHKCDLLDTLPTKEQTESICKKVIQELESFKKKSDTKESPSTDSSIPSLQVIYTSAQAHTNINELKELLGQQSRNIENQKQLVADLLAPDDLVVLVTPIDDAAPKGRLILPQQQTIRDILDADAFTIVCKETQLSETLAALGKKPKMVITDSQAFGIVNKIVPKDILLTSFSILFARYKGSLETVVKGAAQIDQLQDGDTILISEGCTHHRQCGDIGTVKLPNWIKAYTKKQIHFAFTSGKDFPEDVSPYALIIHCGACMLNEQEMKHRMKQAKEQGIPITNYGIAIAQVHGILKRSLSPFKQMQKILK